MGGSILAQVLLNQFGGAVPTWTTRSCSRPWSPPSTSLRARAGKAWPTTTAATAACGRRLRDGLCRPPGVSLNVDMLVTEGDGIVSDSRPTRRRQELGHPGRPNAATS